MHPKHLRNPTCFFCAIELRKCQKNSWRMAEIYLWLIWNLFVIYLPRLSKLLSPKYSGWLPRDIQNIIWLMKLFPMSVPTLISQKYLNRYESVNFGYLILSPVQQKISNFISLQILLHLQISPSFRGMSYTDPCFHSEFVKTYSGIIMRPFRFRNVRCLGSKAFIAATQSNCQPWWRNVTDFVIKR